MTLQTYPTTPVPGFTYDFNEGFKTIISEYQGENEQRQGVDRFPKRGFGLAYKFVDVATEWYLIENFFHKRRGGLDPFWYFDLTQRNWVDEYVGRGGPLQISAAISYDSSTGIYVNETIAANDPTVGDVNIHAIAGSGDRYYVLSNVKFDKVTFKISTPGVGSYVISSWKYWNGSSWFTISVSDGTTNFKAAAGDRDVTFTMPSDWVDYEVNGVNGYGLCAEFDAASVTTPPKCTSITVNTKTYDLHSKSTVNDSSFIVYVNDVATSKTFVSGGGGGGGDRFYFADYPATGALITSDFHGKLRIKGVLGDRFEDKFISPTQTGLEIINIREIWW